jgi:hypothetical protein
MTTKDQEKFDKAVRTLASIATMTLMMKFNQAVYDRAYARGIHKR